MTKDKILTTLNWCLYICDVDDIENRFELVELQKKIITNEYTKKDIDALKQLKLVLNKQLK